MLDGYISFAILAGDFLLGMLAGLKLHSYFYPEPEQEPAMPTRFELAVSPVHTTILHFPPSITPKKVQKIITFVHRWQRLPTARELPAGVSQGDWRVMRTTFIARNLVTFKDGRKALAPTETFWAWCEAERQTNKTKR